MPATQMYVYKSGKPIALDIAGAGQCLSDDVSLDSSEIGASSKALKTVNDSLQAGLKNLEETHRNHEEDANAHGIGQAAGPFAEAVRDAARAAVADLGSGDTLAGMVAESVQGAISEKLPQALDEALADVDGKIEERIDAKMGEALTDAASAAAQESLPALLDGRLPALVAGQLDEKLPQALGESLPAAVGGALDEKLPAALEQRLPAAIDGRLDERLPAAVQDSLPALVENSLGPVVEGKLPGIVEGQLVNSETLNGIITGKVETIINKKVENGEISGNTPTGSDGAITCKVPTILAPAAGVMVYASGGITVTTAPYEAIVSGEPHVSTDWQICLDAARHYVLAEAGESQDKIEHTFLGLDWQPDTTYYIFARHRSFNGVSPWSAPHAVRPVSGIASEFGRVLYRHSSGMGTVIEYSDGEPKKMLVLDAKYRGSTTGHVIAPSLPQIGRPIHSSSTLKLPHTDAELNAVMAGMIDPNSAKVNTDALMLVNAPAAKFCRSQLVGGVGCDLPNQQQQARIISDMNAINSLDPSVSAYPDKALQRGPCYKYSTRNTEDTNACLCWHTSDTVGFYCVYNLGNTSNAVLTPILELA